MEDFAAFMQGLTDIPLPEANKIRDLLDKPSTQTAAARCRSLPADGARRILRRIKFHHMPKHASWLNMVKAVLFDAGFTLRLNCAGQAGGAVLRIHRHGRGK